MKLLSDLSHRVYVLSTTAGEKSGGFVLSWIMPASLAESSPRIAFAVSRFNTTLPLLERSGRFTLTLLASHQVKEFFVFGTTHSEVSNKFSQFPHTLNPEGPRLTAGAGFASGEILQVMETPDRKIFYARLLKEEMTARPPLILKDALEKLSAEEKIILEKQMREGVTRDEKQFT